MLEACLMGTGGSMPKVERHLASALFRHNGAEIVIDCGEGTQIAMKKASYPFARIGLILITHFHADHISGLPGMLLTMGNEGRLDPLVIAGPKGLSRVVSSICIIAGGLPFEVRLYEFPDNGGTLPTEVFGETYDPASMSWEDEDGEKSGKKHTDPISDFTVTAFPAHHSVPCLGYRLSLDRAGKFDPQKARENAVPLEYWGRLQKGESVDGFTPDMVLGPARKGIDISYITDSRPGDDLSCAVFRSDLLICEGMFPTEKQERAEKSRHMTAAEAAYIARDGEVGALWLTHYSPSVNETDVCLAEARAVFPDTVAGHDGMTEFLKFPDQTDRVPGDVN